MGEFLKGYMQKMTGQEVVLTGYSQDGDSRGPAQACDRRMYFRGLEPRC
jgi:hypothetical protein